MPTYRYKAYSADGKAIEGALDAESEAAVIQQLRDEGYYPLRAEPATITHTLSAFFQQDLFSRKQLSLPDLSLVTRELATLLDAGLPIDRALEIMMHQAGTPRVRNVLQNIHDSVRGGASVAEAMEKQGGNFPAFYVNMVHAGEAGGSLEGVVSRLAELLEQSQDVSESVRSSLIYPAILVLLAGLSLIFLLTVVLPEFQPLFEEAGKELPLPTRIVMAIAEVVQRYWWVGLLIIILTWIFIRHDRSTQEGALRWDGILLRTPLLGDLVRRLAFARFSRMLGTLLANGVGLVNALSLARGTLGNSKLSKAVDEVTSGVKQGKGLAAPLQAVDVFPRLGADLIKVGEESGQLDRMLLKAADIFDREVKKTMQRGLSLLVPLLTIGLGILIAAIIGSVLIAIFSVNELAI